MIDEKLYHEYANWLIDYEGILKKVTQDSSPFSVRLKHVYDVVDYLYNKLIDDKSYDETEHGIFVSGISYLSEQIYEIENILENIYNNDFESFEKDAKSINLYLNVFDFKNEMSTIEDRDEFDYMNINKFYNDIYNNYIAKRKEVPVSKYKKFDELNEKMVSKLHLDYYSISDIFLEIADELGIV